MLKLLLFVLIGTYQLSADSKKASFDPKDIHIQIGGEPSTLDPTYPVDQYALGILRNINEGLFKLDAEGKLQNGLAESYRVSKDKLTYTFKIKKSLWSDGQAVTADNFVFGLQRLFDPSAASPNAEFFFKIKNARDVYAKKLPLDQLGVKGVGNEVVITLSEPDPALPMALSLPSAAPLRRDAFAANGGKWKFDFPVTGDYLITKYNPAEVIELTPNPKKLAATAKKIVYHILQEETTALNLFESGHLDIISTLPFTEIDRLRSSGVLQSVPSTTVFYLAFNHSKEPFNDVNVRRVFTQAIDTESRKNIASLLKGTYAPMESFLPPSLDGYFDVSKVKPPTPLKLLVPEDLKGRRIRLAFGNSAFTKLVTERLQNEFKAKLGVNLQLEPMELKMLLGRLTAEPPEMHLLGMSATYNDPMNHLKTFGTASGPNYSRYQSAEYEKLLAAVGAQGPGKKRAELARKANELLLLKDFVLIPLVLRTQTLAVSKNIKGFQISPYQVIALSKLQKQNN